MTHLSVGGLLSSCSLSLSLSLSFYAFYNALAYRVLRKLLDRTGKPITYRYTHTQHGPTTGHRRPCHWRHRHNGLALSVSPTVRSGSWQTVPRGPRLRLAYTLTPSKMEKTPSLSLGRIFRLRVRVSSIFLSFLVLYICFFILRRFPPPQHLRSIGNVFYLFCRPCCVCLCFFSPFFNFFLPASPHPSGSCADFGDLGSRKHEFHPEMRCRLPSSGHCTI